MEKNELRKSYHYAIKPPLTLPKMIINVNIKYHYNKNNTMYILK